MIRCGKCFAEIPGASSVCPGCGFVIGAAAKDVPPLGPTTDLGFRENKPFRVGFEGWPSLVIVLGELFLLLGVLYLMWFQ